MSSCNEQNKAGLDIKSPKIKEIAAWAVNEYNKNGHCLKFEKVLKAYGIITLGVTYYIVLEASNGCLLDKYSAIVYEEEARDVLQLQGFKPLSQAKPLLEIDASVGILKSVLDVDASVAIPN